jgi:hypothetical protein
LGNTTFEARVKCNDKDKYDRENRIEVECNTCNQNERMDINAVEFGALCVNQLFSQNAGFYVAIDAWIGHYDYCRRGRDKRDESIRFAID